MAGKPTITIGIDLGALKAQAERAAKILQDRFKNVMGGPGGGASAAGGGASRNLPMPMPMPTLPVPGGRKLPQGGSGRRCSLVSAASSSPCAISAPAWRR